MAFSGKNINMVNNDTIKQVTNSATERVTCIVCNVLYDWSRGQKNEQWENRCNNKFHQKSMFP